MSESPRPAPKASFAFIGAGRMASAMVGGLLTKGAATPQEIACIGGNDDTAEVLARRTGFAAHRAAMIRRPPTVAIRARNPCRRLRTSLLG